MLSTVGDVAAAARKVWPEAVKVDVGLAPTNSISQKMYRVSALADNNCLLGHLDAPNLNTLKALLERRSIAKGIEPNADQAPAQTADCGLSSVH